MFHAHAEEIQDEEKVSAVTILMTMGQLVHCYCGEGEFYKINILNKFPNYNPELI
jgi:hypothetical protein